MKSIRPVKIRWWGVDVVICLEQGAGCLCIVQLMPLHSKIPSSLASFKSRLVLPFWYWLTQVVMEKRTLDVFSSSSSVWFSFFSQCCDELWCNVQVSFPGVVCETFRSLLEFLYTGTTSSVDCIADSFSMSRCMDLIEVWIHTNTHATHTHARAHTHTHTDPFNLLQVRLIAKSERKLSHNRKRNEIESTKMPVQSVSSAFLLTRNCSLQSLGLVYWTKQT